VAARQIHALSIQRWADRDAVEVIGQHPNLVNTLDRLARFAHSDKPALVTGETGTGKELFTRALYLLSSRNGSPFLVVNCAQYQEGQVIASELFGHKRGSFTGAVGMNA
jgi:transcriptional regulator with AAA-type ATPase domain